MVALDKEKKRLTMPSSETRGMVPRGCVSRFCQPLVSGRSEGEKLVATEQPLLVVLY